MRSQLKHRATSRTLRLASFPISCHHHHCDYLIVDGTNVLCNALSGVSAAAAVLSTSNAAEVDRLTPTHAHASAFLAWLKFINHAASASSASFVVFDNTSQQTAAGAPTLRQQTVPDYKKKRHALRDRRAGASPIRDSSSKAVRSGSPAARMRSVASAAEAEGYSVMWAEPGLEADDAICSLAAGLVWGRTCTLFGSVAFKNFRGFLQIEGRMSSEPSTSAAPRVTVCSGDSDMIQLLALSPSLVWMEIAAWPGGRSPHPVAMETTALPGLPWLPVKLHRAAPDGELRPSMYADYLALVGKPEAGVRGVGISSASARTLLQR